jgi:hypothetical protein
MIKQILGLVFLQLVFGLILAGSIFMGRKADARCKTLPLQLKDCHPYPAAGPHAISCTWPSSPEITPWAPVRKCE